MLKKLTRCSLLNVDEDVLGLRLTEVSAARNVFWSDKQEVSVERTDKVPRGMRRLFRLQLLAIVTRRED
jgi:hypothetical protein